MTTTQAQADELFALATEKLPLEKALEREQADYTRWRIGKQNEILREMRRLKTPARVVREFLREFELRTPRNVEIARRVSLAMRENPF